MALTEACLDLASDLGFIRAGVASLEPFERQAINLRHFIEGGYAGSMQYLARAEPGGQYQRQNPSSLMPGARCAICVALPYSADRLKAPSSSPPLVGETQFHKEQSGDAIASYALGADYHRVVKDKLLSLADSLAQLLGRPLTARACVDSAPLFERELAMRAGLLFVGKNTLGIAPGAGSHFVLGELLVDCDLATAKESVDEGCGSCRLCLEACPTNAFEDEYVLDATRCISYLTIEQREDIPRGFRSSIGTRIFGCDACQSSCPYNQSGHKRTPSPDLGNLEHLSAPDLISLLDLGSSAYKRFVAGTALRRINRDQLARNAAIALGNSESTDAVAPLLKASLVHRSARVRRHCSWAIGNLAETYGIPEAKKALLCLIADGDQEVVQEAKRWNPAG